MGGGIAVLDYNLDGFEDLYFTGGKNGDELYKNSGNGSFIRVSNYAGLRLTRFRNTMCVSVGDINNDGLRDLFVGTIRNERSLLYLNEGNGKFREISTEAGINDLGWAMSATFADVNLDGWLDLYVANYVKKDGVLLDDDRNVIGFDHDCFPNKLYLNNGDNTFQEVSSQLGTDNAGCALAVVSSDMDQDHYPDLYIANDFGEWVIPNSFLNNQYPQQSFLDESHNTGLNAAIYGMGIAVGDYDRNGMPDYYVTNLGKNVLYQNLGDNTFVDVAQEAGVDNTWFGDVFSTGWGTVFFDYDQDGHEDLFVSNGYIPSASFIDNTENDPNKLYRNLGDGTFEDVSDSYGMDSDLIGRGAVAGDLDNDGDLDLIVATNGESDEAGNVLIYENDIQTSGNWLKIKLEGEFCNRDGLGSVVQLYSGTEIFYRELIGGSSHASQNSSILHFGLGAIDQIDSVMITWPGGTSQNYQDLNVNRLVYIKENDLNYYIAGCMDPLADNFNPEATYDYGCYIEVKGCLDDEADEFNPEANTSDGSCELLVTSLDTFEEHYFRIYPNPVRDQARIELADPTKEHELTLFDLSGRIIREQTIHATGLFIKGNLAPGIYTLKINNQERTYSQKIVIE
jgi:hypothetical protein